MKVKIGGFVDRWTTREFEEWWLAKRSGKGRFEQEDYVETPLDDFVEKMCVYYQVFLNYTINLYLDKKERKVKIHIDKYDTWSMDSTLAMIILPMLIQLKATKNGSPLVDDEDVPENIRKDVAPDPDDEFSDLNIHKRWDWIMDEMIWAFTQINDDRNDDQFHTGVHDIVWKPIDKDGTENPEGTYRLLTHGKNDTHVFDKEGYTIHYKRIQNGTILFGKYFHGLWD